MGILLLAAFIGVPLVEIAIFVEVGGILGLWPTLGLVVLTAVLGAWQLRAQGLATLMRARDQVERGALPTRELFDGACLLVAGALLLTPGFMTDTAGFLLFFPPVRDILLGFLARHVQARMQTRVFVDGEEVSTGGANGPIIDGEYRDVTEPKRAGPDRAGPDGAGPERPRKLPK
jgi:UPF0716 protein FxsA